MTGSQKKQDTGGKMCRWGPNNFKITLSVEAYEDLRRQGVRFETAYVNETVRCFGLVQAPKGVFPEMEE